LLLKINLAEHQARRRPLFAVRLVLLASLLNAGALFMLQIKKMGQAVFLAPKGK